MAQGLPPQQDYFVGEGQVDLQRGTFLYSNTDIVAGSSDPASQIPFTRINNASGGGVGFFGYATTHSLDVRLYVSKFIEEPAGPGRPSYRFYVVRGSQVETFYHPYMGTLTYEGGSGGYQQLTMSSWMGPFTYTGPDGTIINFAASEYFNEGCRSAGVEGTSPAPWCALATDIVHADGTKWSFEYDSNKLLKLVSSNRGFAVGMHYAPRPTQMMLTQVCAVNTAQSFASVSSPCPGGSRFVQYGYSCPTSNSCELSSFTDAGGNVTTYGYGAIGISTITIPGSASPDMTINYYPNSGKVKSQVLKNGAAWSYTYQYNDEHWSVTPFNDHTDVKAPDNTMVRYGFSGTSKPISIRNQLGLEWSFQYYQHINQALVLTRKTDPEGNYTQYTYENPMVRQPTQTRMFAKPGFALAAIGPEASFPSPCVNPKVCEKPLTATDSNDNVTTFTYDSNHGGVLTETGPAVGGIAPQKRYTYAQRYAWIRDASGTAYVQAATPVWVLTRVRYCRTTAASGITCAGGAADEVIMDYEYGPNSGPNNLLLRGIVVRADNQPLRTCFGYDIHGRKISETKPRAALAVCP
ncbi:hypothetical protein FHS96_005909 [Sphingomonas zeicaulis]|uniref:hypothetical protein n=1 Tax=Sphingomonas zeicaulis TaxID=1632740 RepID=UPI003D1B0ED7